MFVRESINENAYVELYLLDTIYDDNSQKDSLPILLVLPGGGYRYTSYREAQPIAIAANSNNMHAAVLHYTNIKEDINISIDQLVEEVRTTIEFISTFAKEKFIDMDKLNVIGFSAGGHLAATCNNRLNNLINKVVLAYPAIGFSEVANQLYLTDLEKLDEEGQAAAKLFLQDPILEISDKCKDTFIWMTYTDDVVPADGVLKYAQKMREFNVPLELHFFGHGGHGLSLAKENTAVFPGQVIPRISSWVELMDSWLKL